MDKRRGASAQKRASSVGDSLLQTFSASALGLTESDVRPVGQDFAVWVRALRQNWRQGTVGCKGRSDVARTNKKPWKQKGTGRARAGSARSPLWRGGGVTFGPQERSRTLTLPRKQKQRVLSSLLSQRLAGEQVKMLDWQISGDLPKSRQAYETLKKAGVAGKRVTLFVRPDDDLTFRSFRNLPKVNVIAFDQPNAVHLVGTDYWMFLGKDVEEFKTMVGRWS